MVDENGVKLSARRLPQRRECLARRQRRSVGAIGNEPAEHVGQRSDLRHRDHVVQVEALPHGLCGLGTHEPPWIEADQEVVRGSAGPPSQGTGDSSLAVIRGPDPRSRAVGVRRARGRLPAVDELDFKHLWSE